MEADAKDFWNNSVSFEDEYSGWGLNKLSVFNIFKKSCHFQSYLARILGQRSILKILPLTFKGKFEMRNLCIWVIKIVF